jgi:hypothetical protein
MIYHQFLSINQNNIELTGNYSLFVLRSTYPFTEDNNLA